MIQDPKESGNFGTTRGQIVLLLRRAHRTVEELAQALGVTDNAVRVHLASLEKSGLVRQHGLRRGSGKPSYEYSLTPEADRLFPKPYSHVLNALLDVLEERIGSEQSELHMREVGRRMAAALPAPTGDVRTRLQAAVALLNELGGLAELHENGGLSIQGYNCLLLAVVPDHPQVCKLAEALISEFSGVPFQEQCERTEPWHCRFVPRPQAC